MPKTERKKIEGLFLLIDRDNERGLGRWCDELEKRRVPAVIQISEYAF